MIYGVQLICGALLICVSHSFTPCLNFYSGLIHHMLNFCFELFNFGYDAVRLLADEIEEDYSKRHHIEKYIMHQKRYQVANINDGANKPPVNVLRKALASIDLLFFLKLLLFLLLVLVVHATLLRGLCWLVWRRAISFGV